MKKLNKLPLLILLILAFGLIGCNPQQTSATNNENSSTAENMTMQADSSESMNMDSDMNKAVAVIHSNDKDISAWITFTKVSDGVHVHGEFSGFSKGMHAYHVHVYGDCRADDYSSAGPHLKFNKNMPEDAPIVGNLGEFKAEPSGTAVTDTTLKAIEFDDLIGRAVIVHENGNNLNPPPTGNAGARIACGVIGWANPDVMMNSM